jgi:hypothetical protein
MVNFRTFAGVTLAAVLCAARASAQTPPAAPPTAPPAPVPAPPTAPAPTPAPPPASANAPAPAPAPQAGSNAPQDPYGSDPVLSEQIAEQLVERAQELLDAKIYVDAKQLAVEALVKSPKGNAADRARYIIQLVNQFLGIKDDPPPTPPSEVKPDLAPIGDPTAPIDPSKDRPPAPPADTTFHDGRTASMVHGALYGGIIGSTVGAFAGQDNPVSVAVPLGIATGIGAGLVAPRIVKKLGWDEAQVRTAGSINLWGGVIGGLFADAVTGEGEGSPSGKGVLLGGAIGSTVGLFAGGMMAKNKKLTRGDVALVDTLAGIGTVGGLTMGMLMQPAQPEAYAVNSIVGAGAGVIIGVVAGPNTNTTPRRMLRVAGLSALGGAVPFLLYAAIYDRGTDSDEQVVGFLSSAGLIGGAYLGFRLTSDMDVGVDLPQQKDDDDAPLAVLRRSSHGTWSLGAPALSPLSRQLATDQHGVAFTMFGAAF